MQERTHTTRRRAAVAAVASLATVAGLALTAPTSQAEPQTSAIDLASLAAGPQAGTLDNQVDWTVNAGSWAGAQGYAIYPGQSPQVWTFDGPVSVRFGVAGLNLPGECFVVPEGSVLESQAATHSWDETTRRVCRTANDPAGESIFTIAGPVTDLTLEVVGGAGSAGRGPTFIETTYDVPVASVAGPADGSTIGYGTGTVDFTCADGTGDVTGTATIDGQPVANGDSLNGLPPGTYTLEVTCTDEHGATHTTTSTFTVAAPTCAEDGLALLNEPGVDIDRTYVLLSGGIHKGTEDFTTDIVDPLTVPLLGLDATDLVHQINCDLVEPIEDLVDSITVPLIQDLGLQGLFKGLF